MAKILDYLFSDDENDANPTYYCVRCGKHEYVQQTLVHEPWLRKTTSSKCGAFWMKWMVAGSLCKNLQQAGHPEARVEKVHWWNLLGR